MIKYFTKSSSAVRIFNTLIINFGFSFLFSVLVARLLSVDDRGAFFTYQVTSLFIMGAASFSLPNTIVYKLRSAGFSRFCRVDIVVFVTLSAILSAILSGLFSALVFPDLSFGLLFFCSICMLLTSALTNVLKIERKMHEYSIVMSATPIALVVGFVPLLLFDSVSLVDAVVAFILSRFLLAAFILFRMEKFREENVTKGAVFMTDFWSYAGKMSLLRLVGDCARFLDKFIVSYFFPATVVGYYAVAMSLETISSRFFQLVTDHTFSELAGRSGSVTKKFYMLVTLGLAVGIVGILFSYGLGGLLITSLFGEKFSPAAEFLPPVIINSVLAGWNTLFTQYFVANGIFKVIYINQAIAILFMLVAIPMVMYFDHIIYVLYAFVFATLIRLALILTAFYKATRCHS